MGGTRTLSKRLVAVGATAILCAPVGAGAQLLLPGIEAAAGDAKAHRITEPKPVRSLNDQAGNWAAEFDVEVGADGRVTAVKPIRGRPQDLGPAAAYVRTWRYRPFVRNGKPAPARVREQVMILPSEAPRLAGVGFPAGDLRKAKVTLARNACFGTCPIYSVTIHGDGRVVYHGTDFVTVVGDHRSQVTPGAALALMQKLKAANVFSLRDEYRSGPTDFPTTTVTTEIGGKTKTVVDYLGLQAGMPLVVDEIEDDIDRLAGSSRWVSGSKDTVPYLVSAGWNFRSKASGELLVRAGLSAPDDVILGLVQRGAPTDAVVRVMSRPTTAAQAVAQRGRIAPLRAIIRSAAIRAADKPVLGRLLGSAAESARPDVIAEVLALRPDVDQRDDQGRTPLIIAAGSWRRGDGADAAASVDVLVRRGADVRAADAQGSTALHAARTAATARALLVKKAPLEVRDRLGNTPLTATTSEDVAFVLIEAGARVDAKDNEGVTIRERAKRRRWSKVLALLERQSGRRRSR